MNGEMWGQWVKRGNDTGRCSHIYPEYETRCGNLGKYIFRRRLFCWCHYPLDYRTYRNPLHVELEDPRPSLGSPIEDAGYALCDNWNYESKVNQREIPIKEAA